MKCRLCGKRLKFKDLTNHVCSDCYENLPKCVQENIENLNATEIKKIMSKFRTPKQFVNPEQYKVWFRYGAIGVTTTGVVLDKRYIVLFKDIKNFYFDFIPRRRGKENNICFGEYSFSFELSGIPYEFRTLVLRDATSYKISNGEFCPDYFPNNLLKLAMYIKKGVADTAHNLEKEKRDYETKNGYTYEGDNRSTTNESNAKGANQKKKTYSDTNLKDGDLADALKLFHISFPYTEQELKTVYRKMIRQCHPDQQVRVSALKAEDVNRYYDLLKNYCVN